MKNSIEAVKSGNMINVFVNGKLYKKNCGNTAEADNLFKVILKAKENPTDDAIKEVMVNLIEKLRVAYLTGLEHDPETGDVFLAGFNTPLPQALVDVVLEYHEKGYPMEAIINFWKLLMINPDIRVRSNLFKFIVTHDFVLTDRGYMVVYKAVDYKEKDDSDLAEFVSNQYLHVKQDWKCNPNKYAVYRNNDGELAITKWETIEGWEDKGNTVDVIGKLGDLNARIDKLAENSETVYTDLHTHTMEIKLGVPVKMERRECDSDPQRDCSYGLHVGATKYVENFGNDNGAILVCLVNPAHVVAVPNYDHSKMRVAEYFPFAVATYTDRKIDIIKEAYFESDYAEYEENALEEMVEKAKAGEFPLEATSNGGSENRPFSELIKILEARLVDLQ